MGICVDEVTKRFGDLVALDRASFRAEAGQVTGFLGANGAGKTTTMRILATLLRPTSGRASVDGVDVVEDSLEARKRVGLLTEEVGLFDRLTPREVLAAFAGLHEISSGVARVRIDRLTELLELGPVLDRRCGTLSKGNRQKVALARALLHEPRVLLLDEPTAGLDVVAATVTSVRASWI